jgi:hypothetical protein
VRGYRDFPAITPRWGRTSPEDVYGTGPGHEALPDVRQLQTLVRRKLQLLEKKTMPALKGHAEISGFPSQLPGAFTRVPGGGGPGDKLEPIYVPESDAIEQVRADIRELQWKIREELFADLWRIITDDERAHPATAEEIRAKKEERLLQLGPVGNNIEREYFRRALDRVFYMADRRGMLPEPPPELADQELKVEFLSIFGEAQRAQEIPAVERVAAFIKALSELDGEVLDTGDWDRFADKYADIAGLPPELMRSPEDRSALRAQRAQKKLAQDAGAAMVAGAKGVRDLSQANLESDSALTRILGTLGPVAAAQAGAPVAGGVA